MHAYECICIDLQHEYAALTLREECVWGYLLVVDVEFYLSGHIALYLDAHVCLTFKSHSWLRAGTYLDHGCV